MHKKAKVCTVDFNIAPFAPFAHSFLRMHAYILYILFTKEIRKIIIYIILFLTKKSFLAPRMDIASFMWFVL